MFTGAVVNGAAVILGGIAGCILKRGIPKRMGDTVMKAMALYVMYIGISGALDGENTVVEIISLALGTVIGEALDLDKRINQLGDWLALVVKTKDNEVSIANGFVSCSLLICVGAMAIVGSIQSGINGSHDILIAKSIIDCVAAVVMAATLGIGVAFAGVLVLLYEGLLTLCATFIEPVLTTAIMNEMNCVGSVLIIGIGINMISKDKIRVMNCVPAVFLPILLCRFF